VERASVTESSWTVKAWPDIGPLEATEKEEDQGIQLEEDGSGSTEQN